MITLLSFSDLARRTVLTLAAVGLAHSVQAQSFPGQLDPAFGTDGQVVIDLEVGGRERASAILLQADGRIVAAGRIGADFALLRVDSHGVLDPTFGHGGYVVTDVPGAGEIHGIAQQPDGKLVVAGVSGLGSGNADLTLARYEANGTLDPTFGRGGIVTTDVFGHDDTGFAVVVQPDGRIVAAGRADQPNGTFLLARYHADGTPDLAFGRAGVASASFPGDDATARALVLAPDGTFVAAGRAGTSPVYAALAGFTADGQSDPTFGGGASGIAGVTLFDGVEASGLVRLDDGALLLAGTASSGGLRDAIVAKFRPSARTLDASFGALLGIGLANRWDFSDAAALAVQPDGKILVAGTTSNDFALVRFGADGLVDLSWQGGAVTTDFGGRVDQAFALALQPDGRLVVGGAAGDDVAMARYFVDPPPMPVSVDIRPNDRHNRIVPAAGGGVAVAILSTPQFNAETIAPGSVCFGDDDHPEQRDCSERHGMGHVRDVNGDRLLDLVLHFDVRESGIDRGDTRACLTGTTYSGFTIAGCDRIRTR